MSAKKQKITIVGDPGIGKTSLFNAYVQGNGGRVWVNEAKNRDQAHYMNNAVADVTAADGTQQQVWDKVQQHVWGNFSPGWEFKGADGVIIAFDLTNFESYLGAKKWWSELNKHTPGIPLIIVGLKSDLAGNRAVEDGMGKELAEDLQSVYMECSAHTKQGVKEVFAAITKKISEKHQEQDLRHGSAQQGRTRVGSDILQDSGQGFVGREGTRRRGVLGNCIIM